MRIPLKFFMVS